MSWLSKLTGGNGKPGDEIPELVTFQENDSRAAELGLVRELVSELIKFRELPGSRGHQIDLTTLQATGSLLAGDRDRQAHGVAALVIWLAALDRKARQFRSNAKDRFNPHLEAGWGEIWETRNLLHGMLGKLLARKLALSHETLHSMLDWCLESEPGYLITNFYPLSPLIANVEAILQSAGGPEGFETKLAKLSDLLGAAHQDTQSRKLIERIHAILGTAPEIPIDPGEVWADAALEDLATLDKQVRASWAALLYHSKTASGAAPSAKWLKEAGRHLQKLTHDQVAVFLSRWFSLTDKKPNRSALSIREWNIRCADEAFNKRRYEFFQLLPRERRNWNELEVFDKAIQEAGDPWDYLLNFHNQPEARMVFGEVSPRFQLPASPPAFAPVEDLLILPQHMDLLVGLAWTSGLLREPAITRSLGALAVSMYRKVPGIGPRAVRVGNSCISALGMIGDAAALGQLALLKVKVKFGGAQAAIDKAMTKLAASLGVSREDLEEMSVPSYGMTEVGRLAREIGAFTAELTVISSRSTELKWIRADGKFQKSLPAAVKQEFAEEVKELMAAKKDIEKMLPAQAERLDGLYLRRKSWPLAVWRVRYLDHPLVGALARRLIWNFTTDGTTSAGVWVKDKVVDRLGSAFALDEEKSVVALWHPLHQDPKIVLGWRGFLEEWEIVQPFKQAHREVYLITPAEELTVTYSNRFAAHLLRQHQFNALCAARGWKNRLRLMVDDEYPPATRWLSEWGLRAEYWIEGVGTEYGEDTLESGAYRYLTTDQIRFYQEDASQLTAHAGGGGYGSGWRQGPAGEPVPLHQVDPMVFSEIMRDADLFVGVSSVGNDPNWLDGGRNEHQRNYWGSYSFGELNASAQTRKAILERLVSKLKIAGACSFEDKFLIVRGKRHSYKIHLGSGNVLVMPQDKYLCIVPAQGQVDKAGDKIFLPFEGDRTLSVILSKAFLLAADDKIVDPTILRQLA